MRPTSSTVSVDEMRTGTRRHSPIFLVVFMAFLITTLICVAGTLIGVLSAHPSHHDTQWFWASGHLLVHGQNPYDEAAVLRIETALGLQVNVKDVPILRNPPTAMFLMAPMGFLSARTGVLLWAMLLAALFLLSLQALRGMVGNQYEKGYLLLMFFFAPALYCIEVGQTGLIVLAGLALFLRFHQSRGFWAGTALSLCAIKPHLLLPFAVVLLVWIVVRRRWAIFCGAFVALLLESLIAMAFDHSIWTHYRSLMGTERFADEFIPTLSVALRFLIDQTALWIEFVPAALACAWALWYYRRNRDDWDWMTHGSLLTLVSLAVAPYAWLTDQVVAIPAILFALFAPGGPRKGSVTLLMVILIATELQMMTTSTLFYKPDMLLGPLWIGWYLYATSDASAKEALAAA